MKKKEKERNREISYSSDEEFSSIVDVDVVFGRRFEPAGEALLLAVLIQFSRRGDDALFGLIALFQ